jgi:hypothetical protein
VYVAYDIERAVVEFPIVPQALPLDTFYCVDFFLALKIDDLPKTFFFDPTGTAAQVGNVCL